MLSKLRKRIFSIHQKEKGYAELVSMLIIFPIFVILLFTMVNLSSYFQSRSQIQDVARDGARLVALYGGNDTANTRRNTSGKTVSQAVKDRLWVGGKCTLTRCTKAPEVSCYVVNAGGGKIQYSTEAGQLAKCEITYYYQSVAPLGLGFGGLMNPTIKVSSTFVTETGYR